MVESFVSWPSAQASSTWAQTASVTASLHAAFAVWDTQLLLESGQLSHMPCHRVHDVSPLLHIAQRAPMVPRPRLHQPCHDDGRRSIDAQCAMHQNSAAGRRVAVQSLFQKSLATPPRADRSGACVFVQGGTKLFLGLRRAEHLVLAVVCDWDPLGGDALTLELPRSEDQAIGHVQNVRDAQRVRSLANLPSVASTPQIELTLQDLRGTGQTV
mmetsp:Transcript_86305/g.277032  ORF Transcript_86305/g.277032 Transcript_86305/m.277032 type:complete len:213 (+) Transcript_86305:534-1172(+)